MSQSYTPYQQVLEDSFSSYTWPLILEYDLFLSFESSLSFVHSTNFHQGPPQGPGGYPAPPNAGPRFPTYTPAQQRGPSPPQNLGQRPPNAGLFILYSLGSSELSSRCRWAPAVPADAPWDASTTAATTDRLHLPCASGWNLGEYQYHIMRQLFRVGT